MALLLMLLLAGLAGAAVPGPSDSREPQCEPVKLDISKLCPDYNSTGMPNLMGHQLQGDAKAGLETFLPLIQFGCSKDLQFFLCSVHVPMCVSLPPSQTAGQPAHQLIGPCRPLCERVRQACLRILQNFNLAWPEALGCDRFPPANNHQHMCMEGGRGTSQGRPGSVLGPGSALNSLQNYPELLSGYKEISKEKPELAIYDPIIRILENSVNNIQPAKGYSGSGAGKGNCKEFAYPSLYSFVNRSGPGECVPQCGKNILFDQEDKQFAEVWLGVWASLCLLSTGFTLATFLLEPGRWQYPEKCVIFISLAYSLQAAGLLVRLGVGAEGVACSSGGGAGGVALLVRPGLPPSTACTTVFLLLLYSWSAAAVWWLVCAASWAVGVWAGLEAAQLAAQAPLLHTLGWGLPALHTLAALLAHQVEGDELTGVCLPGQQSDPALLAYLVVPHCIALGAAFAAFLAGLVGSLVTNRPDGRRLLARITVFFILYSVPQACVVASLVWELMERRGWRTELANRPSTEVFILRQFMLVVVGVVTPCWLLSRHTLQAWRRVLTAAPACWRQAKPPTPVFPKVGYQPAGRDVLTLERLSRHAPLPQHQQLDTALTAPFLPTAPQTYI